MNIDTTICMVFKKCNRVEQFDMFYNNNNRLPVVQKFAYLGVTLSYNGLFYQAQKALANQSLKSLFALNSIFVENIHLKWLKQVLGVHSKTSNPTIYGEFARFPLSVIRKIRIIRYWYNINRNPSSLRYKCMYLKDNNGTLINTWSKYVTSLLSSLGFAYIWYIVPMIRV